MKNMNSPISYIFFLKHLTIMNIKYKIGTCYLNIPGEKEKSIPYLEEAVKNASYDAKTDSFKEKRAPLDAYFSLGKSIYDK